MLQQTSQSLDLNLIQLPWEGFRGPVCHLIPVKFNELKQYCKINPLQQCETLTTSYRKQLL